MLVFSVVFPSLVLFLTSAKSRNPANPVNPLFRKDLQIVFSSPLIGSLLRKPFPCRIVINEQNWNTFFLIWDTLMIFHTDTGILTRPYCIKNRQYSSFVTWLQLHLLSISEQVYHLGLVPVSSFSIFAFFNFSNYQMMVTSLKSIF